MTYFISHWNASWRSDRIIVDPVKSCRQSRIVHANCDKCGKKPEVLHKPAETGGRATARNVARFVGRRVDLVALVIHHPLTEHSCRRVPLRSTIQNSAWQIRFTLAF